MTRPENEIDVEAFRWRERHEGRTLSAQEQRDFDTWVHADVRHQGAYIRASAATRRFERFRALTGSATSQARPAAFNLSRRQAIAAALATLSVVAAGSWFLGRDTKHPGQRYRTAVGQLWRGRLPDGSQIVMNTATELWVAYSADRHEIRLSHGEVLLTVAREAVHPVVVYLGTCVVRAIGAVFSARRDEAATVTVSQGSVEVVAQDSRGIRQEVGANQQTLIKSDGTASLRQLSDVELARRLAWRDGLLVFSGEPLREAFADFNRYSTRQFRCGDVSVCERQIAGVFQINNPAMFVLAVSNTFKLDAISHANETVFQPRRLPIPPTP